MQNAFFSIPSLSLHAVLSFSPSGYFADKILSASALRVTISRSILLIIAHLTT
jgi:hypothetical protein